MALHWRLTEWCVVSVWYLLNGWRPPVTSLYGNMMLGVAGITGAIRGDVTSPYGVCLVHNGVVRWLRMALVLCLTEWCVV